MIESGNLSLADDFDKELRWLLLFCTIHIDKATLTHTHDERKIQEKENQINIQSSSQS